MQNRLLHIIHAFCFIGIVTLLLSCDTSNNIDSPGENYFVKYYGEDGNQEAVDMIVTEDGSFLLLGNSTGGTQRIILVKADHEGHIQWEKKLGTATDVPKDIEQDFDGNFVILSDFTESADNIDVKLIRILPDGTKLDSVTIGSEQGGSFYNDHARTVTPLNDGGFIVTGYAEFDYLPSDNVDRISSIFHFRFDQNLSPLSENLWEDNYGTGKINVGTKVMQQGDSLYVFGYTNSIEENPNDKLLLVYYSLNNVGIAKNPKYLGDVNDDTESNFVLKVPDVLIDGYLLVSTVNKSTGAPKLRISKLKAPLRFNIVDDKQFDLNVFGVKRLEGVHAAPSLTNPIGYLLVSNEIKETGETDILLSKVNQIGEEVWSINYGSENNDRAAAVAELPDGRIVVFCTIESIVQTKMALLKLNSKGQLSK